MHSRKGLILILLILLTSVASTFAQVIPFSETDSEKLETLKSKAKEFNEANNMLDAANMYNKIAYKYWEHYYINEAISYFNKSLKINEANNKQHAVEVLYNNLGKLYAEIAKFPESIACFEKCLDFAEKSGDKVKISTLMNNLAIVHMSNEEFEKSNEYLQQALELAKEQKNTKLIRSIYGSLAENYQNLGQSTKAMEYFDLYSTFDKHLKAEEVKEVKTDASRKVTAATKEKEQTQEALELQTTRLKITQDSLDKLDKIRLAKQVELLQKERELQVALLEKQTAQLKTEQKLRIIFIGFIVLVSAFSLVLLKLFIDKKKANQLLVEKNEEIKAKNEEISAKNRQITDSIKYASKIQEAILPTQKAIKDHFPESFIFYRPRDIVSGDFYWFSEQEDHLFIAAVDCTGHSVPGAFMSLIGNTLLNEIVNEKKIRKPSEILIRLNTGVVNALKQGGENDAEDDGMDITLCCINKKENKIQIAAGNHQIYLFKDNELQVVNGDVFSIGGLFSRLKTPDFTTHEFDINQDISIYMFSDGYQDQFGGKENTKFMSAPMKKMFSGIQNMNMKNQCNEVERSFESWKGNNKQTDDVLVIGLKVTPY